ncbi:hypothetical protein LTR91_022499 [Friedmanniomyces endolithicus]|nr:hypothetical protein LTS02_013090 [Friedmanniomyces endolithicus]KAK0905497.1 hypothetical protein LTR57_018251 [Friedmanniomyces endolithicus]KAK0956166.1 hypothetical protein LTR91_022499 [Friedmanniomyces endolithicus]KAK1092141.1 hypothetical protein LTR48_004908 [Friedmanniomyces endolithicus]
MSPKIILYTNHRCPYAQRAHITLDTLNLKYEEILIDLDTPRPQWYLDINPRGLVPSLKYSLPGIFDTPEILTESGIVAQFLCDSFPSPLLPASKEDPFSALKRARIAFFVDTWSSKIAPYQFQIIKAEEGAEREAKAEECVKMMEKEIEPLLAGAKPFFGGSGELTFAEVMTAPFVLRMFSFARDGELMPQSFGEKLEALPNFGRWSKAVMENGNVRRVYDEAGVVEGTKKRVKQMAAK